MATKKASGRNVEEWERGTVRLTLRLDEEAMELLSSYAESLGSTKADIVTMALESFKNDKNTQAMMRAARKRRGE